VHLYLLGAALTAEETWAAISPEITWVEVWVLGFAFAMCKAVLFGFFKFQLSGWLLDPKKLCSGLLFKEHTGKKLTPVILQLLQLERRQSNQVVAY
jgi:hypothetical protein